MDNEAYKPYFDLINKYVAIDQETKDLVIANSKRVSLTKKQLLLQEGENCNTVYFIISGKARSYYTDFSGKTTTWWFHFNTAQSNIKNLFLVDYKSFLSKLQSTLSIETLTEVEAIVFSREQVNYLINSSILYERWMRILNEQSFINTYDRVFTLLTMSATDRYEKLIQDEPHLLQLFSNHYIASYLNIAPQSLSRIRAGGAKS